MMTMIAKRRASLPVKVGGLTIGGTAPISVQSMTNTDPHDLGATISQIESLANMGCELVRLAVPDQEAADAIARIKRAVTLPLVADIQFDYRLAIAAIAAGVDKLRINPGNIGGAQRVREVVAAAKDHGIPIRIGVNGGSLPRDVLARYGPTAKAMTEAALAQVALLERLDFQAIVLSVKASDVHRTIEAYRLLAEASPYPLHLGLTEAGLPERGLVHSSIALGSLLLAGIGDTIRVSLTGDPLAEIGAAYEILRALDLRAVGPTVISCPTCGRCQIDLAGLAKEVTEAAKAYKQPWTIAVMGCAVNGPGEARQADLGVAGGKGEGLLFKHGKPIRKVPYQQLLAALQDELAKMAAQ